MIESSLPQSEAVELPPLRPFGSVARSITGYGVATGLMLVSPLLVFAPAALFHCAMRNGKRATWGAVAIAAVLAGIYFSVVANSAGAGASGRLAWISFAAVVFSVVIPAMLIMPLVGRGVRFGEVLLIAILASAVGLGMTEVVTRAFGGFSPYAMQLAQARETGGRVAEVYRSANAGSDVMRWMQQWMEYALRILPAMILVDMILMFVLSLMMYGRLTVWRASARREPGVMAASSAYLFRNLSLPDWLLLAFVFGGLTPVATGLLQQVAANVLAVTLFLYLLQGLAIVRFLLLRAGVGLVGTLFAMAMLIMLTLTGIGLLLLVAAGLFDSFFDFRRFKRKDESHEGHTD